MTLDGALAAAASAIAGMPEAEFAVGLAEVEEEYRRRDDIARARHAAFVASLQLDRAAYELGCRHEADGNLVEAARWFRVAAGGDHADAALRLGRALDRLAGACGRAELHLVTEAAQAYAEAYAAGYPEAADRIDELLAGFAGRREELPREPPARCTHVRELASANEVLSDERIRELSRHAARCITCLADFVALLKSASAALPSGTVTDPFAQD
ncbi:hypothetical protein AB0K34_14515 [Actinomadura sp. NPDC049382]|uniref:hypothetical protein n=1 Tax=Actinomadura sp. NPDC049382 TaxID=3158220 RepID=UPI003412EA3C